MKFKPFASIKEAAVQLGIAPDTIYDIIKADKQRPFWKQVVDSLTFRERFVGLPKKLKPELMGKRYYFRWSDIQDVINGNHDYDTQDF